MGIIIYFYLKKKRKNTGPKAVPCGMLMNTSPKDPRSDHPKLQPTVWPWHVTSYRAVQISIGVQRRDAAAGTRAGQVCKRESVGGGDPPQCRSSRRDVKTKHERRWHTAYRHRTVGLEHSLSQCMSRRRRVHAKMVLCSGGIDTKKPALWYQIA